MKRLVLGYGLAVFAFVAGWIVRAMLGLAFEQARDAAEMQTGTTTIYEGRGR